LAACTRAISSEMGSPILGWMAPINLPMQIFSGVSPRSELLFYLVT
jgi:hypothetical protein